MINEDKAKQIARNIAYNLGNKVCDDIKTYGYEDVYNAALQAVQWKDEQHKQEKQQWIDEALKFLDDNFEYYSGLKIECLLEDFKKEMEEL